MPSVSRSESPYLSHSRRLADVLAAIQVLGAYTFASLKYESWVEKLGDPQSAMGWNFIFAEHPEFFRVSGEWVSLRWRHGYDRTYSHEQARDLTHTEISNLTDDERGKLTRRPLTPDQIEALMKTAIELHSREVAHQQERRWPTPLLFALLGTILGIVLQSALK
jgi:hypothetical protein